jgi:hypothetical protein
MPLDKLLQKAVAAREEEKRRRDARSAYHKNEHLGGMEL